MIMIINLQIAPTVLPLETGPDAREGSDVVDVVGLDRLASGSEDLSPIRMEGAAV